MHRAPTAVAPRARRRAGHHLAAQGRSSRWTTTSRGPDDGPLIALGDSIRRRAIASTIGVAVPRSTTSWRWPTRRDGDAHRPIAVEERLIARSTVQRLHRPELTAPAYGQHRAAPPAPDVVGGSLTEQTATATARACRANTYRLGGLRPERGHRRAGAPAGDAILVRVGETQDARAGDCGPCPRRRVSRAGRSGSRWATRGAADRVARAMREHPTCGWPWIRTPTTRLGQTVDSGDAHAAERCMSHRLGPAAGSARRLLTFAETSIRNSGYTTAHLGVQPERARISYASAGVAVLMWTAANSDAGWPFAQRFRPQLRPMQGIASRRAEARGGSGAPDDPKRLTARV